MGKVPKFKNRAPSAKSRAARRAESPSLAADKSLEPTINNADTADQDISVLSARKGGGVSKKKKQKPLSRQQRLRKEKGMARADAVIEKLEVKVKRSKDRGKAIKNRSAAWEDLNTTVSNHKDTKKKSPNEKTNTDAAMEEVDIDSTNVSEGNASASWNPAQNKVEINMANCVADAPDEIDDIT